MKVCLYLEFSKFLNGYFYKNAGTGFLSSFKNFLKALRLNGVLVTENLKEDYDILHINIPFLKSLLAARSARRRGVKIVMSAHATAEDFTGVWRISNFLMPLARRYYRFAYNKADIVIAPTEYTKNLLLGYPLKKRIEVVSCGVDFLKFKETEKRNYHKSREELIVFNVGNAIPRKGIKSFIGLAEKFPNNRFFWCGKIFKSFLYKRLPKNLPSNLEFKGFVPDILEIYRNGDIFVFPSYEENQGMVILEAASAGLPILVRDLPAYRGWLFDGENCLIAKSDEEFARKLEQLMEDVGLRERLGAAAEKMAESHDLKNIGKKLREIYQNLL
ncbi:glycosyltransferase family 4 protein [Candidatus Falkowbacteria bacterium]|nr:glycosyltransferase family 4 protein [Candidatus Falkowbacteria bacterium]